MKRYPPESMHGLAPSEALIFLIAKNDGRAVGCGALRHISSEIAELKRLFVRPDHRGRGLSRRILAKLESAAAGFGHERIWLETGDKQPEAVGLYESSGYSRIPLFGEYVTDPHSICYEKIL
jgi:GNAT superfamily N-acetyltransferase